uniref:DDE-1 domain-containing protein n=1 Tax=Moniliophthora roreri TaxID=221103 RepID=A0A0W0GC52_MONRR
MLRDEDDGEEWEFEAETEEVVLSARFKAKQKPDICGWDILQEQIIADLKKKQNTLLFSQLNQLFILQNFANLCLKGVKVMAASKEIAHQWHYKDSLSPGVKEVIANFQDESSAHAFDTVSHAWLGPGQQILMKKSRGRLIHDSDFINEIDGHLVIWNPDGTIKSEAWKIIHPAIEVFEEAHPDCQALFVFDQSSTHAALGPDSLRAFDMNKSNGGAQRKQKDTIIPDSNPDPQFCGKVQKMTTESGEAKGLQQVLEERSFNVKKMRAKCKPGWVKYRYREIPKKNFQEAKDAMLECLDSCPTDVIQRFINQSWRFMDAYQKGLTGKAAAWAVKKQCGHCTVSVSAYMALEAVLNQ